MFLSDEEWQAILLSLRVAALATLFSLPFGLAAAYALARGRFAGHFLLNTLVHVPLVLPPVATGYLLLLAFSPQGVLGRALAAVGLQPVFHWTGAVLAAAVMAFPLMVRAMRLSLEAVDVRLEQAAASLGASRAKVFFTITVPLMSPGIAAGAVLAFVKAFGEFGATITFVGNIAGETQTLPIAIYTFLQVPQGEAAALRLVWIALAIAVLALPLSEWAARAIAARIGQRLK